MRHQLALACGFWALASVAYGQQLTVADALAMRDRTSAGAFATRAEWNALTYYLQGVIEGAVGSGETLASQNKERAFCPPPGKGYSVDEVFRYFEKTNVADRARPAALVIVEAYADAYPC
ncbi:MAG: Rap1a/Tai family immunity protein [Pseudomonadota bacterium]